MATQTAPRVTIAMLDEWQELDDERKDLGRKAATISKAQKEIESDIALYVEAKGGKAKSCTVGVYTLRLAAKRVSIQWKNVVLRLCGKSAVDAEEESAETKETLVIDRAA